MDAGGMHEPRVRISARPRRVFLPFLRPIRTDRPRHAEAARQADNVTRPQDREHVRMKQFAPAFRPERLQIRPLDHVRRAHRKITRGRSSLRDSNPNESRAAAGPAPRITARAT